MLFEYIYIYNFVLNIVKDAKALKMKKAASYNELSLQYSTRRLDRGKLNIPFQATNFPLSGQTSRQVVYLFEEASYTMSNVKMDYIDYPLVICSIILY